MLGLPHSTEISKQLPKKTIFEKFDLKPAQRDRFDADVSKIFIVNVISPATVPAVAAGEKVQSIYVLQVQLKRKTFNPKNIQLLTKVIPQNMVIALQYEDEVMLGVFRSCMVYSNWLPATEAGLHLQGTNLDTLWDNIATSIGGFEIEDGNTVEEQITKDDTHARLLREINELEVKARAEKQSRKKLLYFEEIKKMKQGLI